MAAGLLGVQIVGTLPVTANHIFLEFLCLALLALLQESKLHDSKAEELTHPHERHRGSCSGPPTNRSCLRPVAEYPWEASGRHPIASAPGLTTTVKTPSVRANKKR